MSSFLALTTPLAAFLACLLLLAGLLRAHNHLPLDHPNERSLHASPVPRVGGLGVMAGLLAATLLLWQAMPLPVIGIALGLALLSWFDDVRGLSVRVRLPAHLLAAALLLLLLDESDPMVLVLGSLAIVWMTNLYNFMDGADGLAGGMAVTGFGAYGIAAWLGGVPELAALGWAIAAAALGFLWFNFPPARVFMGDAGSIPLGFLAAGIGWLGVRHEVWHPLFPLLVFSPFIVDASVTLAARLRRGEKVWQAHRGHYYQRLVRMGCSHRCLALSAYGVMGMTALTALAMEALPESRWGVVFAWAAFYLWAMRRIDRRWRALGHET
jgi:UDP-GlcNAc:undecaprenyl-phosphate/decaprenyl-phosphate GlcNAc-1-phosphate transferase